MLFFRSTSSQFRLGLILIVNHKALTASKNILMTVLSTVRKSIWQKTTFLTGDQQPPTPIFKKNVNCGSLADHGLVFMDRTKKKQNQTGFSHADHLDLARRHPARISFVYCYPVSFDAKILVPELSPWSATGSM